MGFIGLEKIIDSIKKSSKYNSIFINVPLSELKFVVDGNQLVYIFLSWYQDSEYGGNYDKMYENYVQFLLNFQPYIQVVIFNGSKDNEKKAKERSKRKIERLSNFNADENYFSYLKEFNPLFSRYVLIEALDHLGIEYLLASEIEDHAIACYANGHGPSAGFFTVLSKDTYFNTYYLEKGYVSWKYVSDLFKDFTKINNSLQVPVFYLRNLLTSNQLSFNSWLYFCILLGDYDNDLNKNIKYFRQKNLDTRPTEYYKLIEHFRRNQRFFHLDNYRDIRSTYDTETIRKVDEIINLFQFKTTKVTYMTSLNQNLNDFDRFIHNIVLFKKVYFPSSIENLHEPSVFEPCLDLYYIIYTLIKQQFESINKLNEYLRVKNPTRENLLVERSIKVGDFETPSIYSFLKSKSEKSILNGEIDNLSLFFTSLCLMTKFFENKSSNYSVVDFRDALFMNLILINLKNDEEKLREDFDIKSNDIDVVSSYSFESDVLEIKKLYDEFGGEFDQNYYLSDEIKVVHLINQFQVFYHAVGVLNKIAKFNLIFLSPHRVLNGLFVCKFMNEKLKTGTNSYNLNQAIEENEAVLNFKNLLMDKFDQFYQEFNSEEQLVEPENSEDLSQLLDKITI